MRAKLPAHFHSALEIRAPPKGSSIYSAIQDLVEFYHLHFEMIFPGLNTPLLLIKHIRVLGLPSKSRHPIIPIPYIDIFSVELYPAVRCLASLLNINFTYPISQKGGYRTIAYPEVRLMTLIIIATKLSQPFDDISRYPESESDPSTVQIDWTKWNQIMAEPPSSGLRRGEEVNVTDADVLGMSEKAIDDYLDWYQRDWIDDRDPKSMRLHVVQDPQY
jgi:RNA polymerase I-specific transcription initiation factor RRN7